MTNPNRPGPFCSWCMVARAPCLPSCKLHRERTAAAEAQAHGRDPGDGVAMARRVGSGEVRFVVGNTTMRLGPTDVSAIKLASLMRAARQAIRHHAACEANLREAQRAAQDAEQAVQQRLASLIAHETM